MAKKTIFEGTVNGVKFDNVKEYNERVRELMDAGESVNASTKTTIVDEKDSQDNENPSTNLCFRLPGFDGTDPKYTSNMDSLNGTDHDCEVIDTVNDYLDLVENNIKTNVIDNLNKADKLNYLSKVEDVIKKLDEDRCKTDSALKKLNNEIIILNQKLELLANGLALNDIYLMFYKNLKDIICNSKTDHSKDDSNEQICANCKQKDCDGLCNCAQEDFGGLDFKEFIESLRNILKYQ